MATLLKIATERRRPPCSKQPQKGDGYLAQNSHRKGRATLLKIATERERFSLTKERIAYLTKIAEDREGLP